MLWKQNSENEATHSFNGHVQTAHSTQKLESPCRVVGFGGTSVIGKFMVGGRDFGKQVLTAA